MVDVINNEPVMDFSELTQNVRALAPRLEDGQLGPENEVISAFSKSASDLIAGKPGEVLNSLVVWHRVVEGGCEEMYRHLTEEVGLDKKEANRDPDLHLENLVRRGLHQAVVKTQRQFSRNKPPKVSKTKQNLSWGRRPRFDRTSEWQV